jgi:hypothetical protein
METRFIERYDGSSIFPTALDSNLLEVQILVLGQVSAVYMSPGSLRLG